MEVSSQFMILVPLIIGITQVFKVSLKLGSQYVPIVALLLGVLGAFLLGSWDVQSGIQGIIAGLTASGLWSSTKTTIGK